MPTPLTTSSGLKIGIAARHRSPYEFSADELRMQRALLDSHVIGFHGAMKPERHKTQPTLGQRFVAWLWPRVRGFE